MIVLTISKNITTTLISGRNGARNARPIVSPKTENGRIKHTGQRSTRKPSPPATVDARLAPRGQVPSLSRKNANPALSDRSAIKIIVKMISDCVTGGLASFGSASPKYPSSHAKNALRNTANSTNGRQKFLDCRKVMPL